jgi:regulator of cell morphogenesis and NO signaling
MTVELTTKVGELVMARPETLRYFEGLGIDYCCGGHRTLADACRLADQDAAKVLADLATLAPAGTDTPDLKALAAGSLTDLLRHIMDNHHEYIRRELPRLTLLMGKVKNAHGANHAELARVEQVFQALAADLMPHLMKEEQILFPFIQQMDQGAVGSSCFGSVQSPIRVMEMEHDAVGAMLLELRELTQNYTAPADGCATFQALYAGFQELEADLHLHIYLENQVLHPRATAMEASLRG